MFGLWSLTPLVCLHLASPQDQDRHPVTATAYQEAAGESGGSVPALVITQAVEVSTVTESLMGNNMHISLSSIFMGFNCSTSTLAVPNVSSSSNPLFPALTGSAFFSIFAGFVLCLNDVSDQVQSTAVLTAFLHQSAFFFVSSKPFSIFFLIFTLYSWFVGLER